MSTEKKQTGGKIWLAPVLLALPVLAGAAIVVLRWGGAIRDLVKIVVKMAVTG